MTKVMDEYIAPSRDTDGDGDGHDYDVISTLPHDETFRAKLIAKGLQIMDAPNVSSDATAAPTLISITGIILAVEVRLGMRPPTDVLRCAGLNFSPDHLPLFFYKRASCPCFKEAKERLKDKVRTVFCNNRSCGQ